MEEVFISQDLLVVLMTDLITIRMLLTIMDLLMIIQSVCKIVSMILVLVVLYIM